jgi:hypothetical protein
MAVRITRAGVGLTVGIIILALVVLGGLYLVKQRGEQARRDDAIEIAQENLEAETEGGALTPTEEEGASSDEQQQSTETNNDQQATQNDGVATTSPEQLPATGPGDLGALFVVALLGFVAASYITSRRVAAGQ